MAQSTNAQAGLILQGTVPKLTNCNVCLWISILGTIIVEEAKFRV